MRFICKANKVEQFPSAFGGALFSCMKTCNAHEGTCKPRAQMHMHACHHRFKRGHFSKHADILEGARETQFCALPAWQRVNARIFKLDLAACGRDEAGDEIEQSRLARAIRPNQTMHTARFNAERHIINRCKSAEAHGEMADIKTRPTHEGLRVDAPVRPMRHKSKPRGMKMTTSTMIEPLTRPR